LQTARIIPSASIRNSNTRISRIEICLYIDLWSSCGDLTLLIRLIPNSYVFHAKKPENILAYTWFTSLTCDYTTNSSNTLIFGWCFPEPQRGEEIIGAIKLKENIRTFIMW